MFLQNSLYLVAKLPFTRWRPTDVDLRTLLEWLVHHPVSSIHHKIARNVLSHACPSLPRPHRRAVALAVVAAEQEILAAESSAGYIEAGVKQFSHLAVEGDLAQYRKWAWSVLPRMRLHAVDDLEGQRCSVAVNDVAKVIEGGQVLDFDLDEVAQKLVKGERRAITNFLVC